MTTFSKKLTLPPIIKPKLIKDVTIELKDGSQLKLSKEVASKLDAIRQVIIDTNGYDIAIPFTGYPAQDIRLYLRLMDKIDKREALPDVRLIQLFSLINVAEYLGNNLSVTNIADYILATTLTNRDMTVELKNATRINYRQLISPLIDDFIMGRLGELNRSLSFENVRDLEIDIGEFSLKEIFRSYRAGANIVSSADDPMKKLAIDGQGRVVVYLIDKKIFYDETDPQREKLINSLIGPDRQIQIGGVTERGVTVVLAHLDRNSGWRNLYKYLPGRPEGEHLISIDASSDWVIFPLGSRLLVMSTKSGVEIRQIYNLIDGSLVYQYQLPEYDRLPSAMDKEGKYLLIALKSPRHYPMFVARLIAMAETAPGANGQLVRNDRILFEIPISPARYGENYAEIEKIIDPYRQLIYITDSSSRRIQKRTPRGQRAERPRPIVVLLVINFAGQVLHRYVYFKAHDIVLKFYPTAKHLITYERGLSSSKLRISGVRSEDLRHIIPPTVTRGEFGSLAKLPPYEIWPAAPITVSRTTSRSTPYINFWIRDTSNGFKVKALVQNIKHGYSYIISSTTGDYVVATIPIPSKTRKSSVIKTVFYTDSDVRDIRGILG